MERLARSGDDLRARVVRAAEAISDGDGHLAVAILAGLEADLAPTPIRRHACARCGAAFRWPGERLDHEDRVHFEELDRAA